jgi:hypothetical protein
MSMHHGTPATRLKDLDGRTVTAMTALLILAVLLGIAYLVALGLTVHRDGLGTRRPPRSHREWWEDAPQG